MSSRLASQLVRCALAQYRWRRLRAGRWRAPAARSLQTLLAAPTGPLDPADFPGSFANGVPDGRSYWTLNRELADEYAAAHGTDVISVSIPRGAYDAMLDVLKHAPGAGEFPYPGPGGYVEVAIPRWMVAWLNNFGPGS